MPKAPVLPFALACTFAFLTAVPSHADPKSYDETIVLPADASPGLKAGLDDILGTLQKMTGREFKFTAPPATAVPAATVPATPPAAATAAVAPAPPAAAPLPLAPATGGIRLVRATDPLAAGHIARALQDKGPEAFYILGDNTRLLIVANTDAGFSYGLYNYLDRLGARWFFPNDNWTIIPPRSDIRLTVDRIIAPAFKARGFFGTGGPGRAGINRHYDLKDDIPHRWDLWKWRNGFGGEYTTGGHAGEDFNTRHKAELLAHPEYLAEIGGVRQPWSAGAKPDASNPGLVELYVKDRVNLFERQLAQNPAAFAITVEPADGGGYCSSGPCTKIGDGSVSDQTFYLANQVAKAVAAKWPGKHVSLLAYGEHILPPSFDLEPNVYVSVIPYGFNYTGLTGEELLAKWSDKLPQLGLYDYWGIPDWSLDMPNFDYLHIPAQRIRYWHDHHVIGFAGESSISAGTVAIGWYLASRLMWDPKADTDALLADFYAKAFGPAAPPMKRMLERWCNGFLMTDHELGLSFRDWNEARRLAAGNEPVMARLDDYGRYLHYLRLLYELRYDASKSKNTGPNGTAQAYMAYMWNIYDSAMVEPFRLTQLTTARWAPTPENVALYNGKDAPGWKGIHQLTRAEIDALLADDTATYVPLDFENHSYGGDLVPLPAALSVRAAGDKPTPITLYGNITFELLVPPGMTSAPFSLAAGRGPAVPFKLMDATGKILLQETTAPESAKAVTLNFPAPGRYTLKTMGSKALHSITIPPGLGFTTRTFTNSQGFPAPRMYFYMPKGQKTLAYYLMYKMIPHVYDGSGKEVMPRIKSAPGICVYDVPAGQDGQVWSFGDLRIPQPLIMLNAPSAFAVSPDQLLVPADALKSAKP